MKKLFIISLIAFGCASNTDLERLQFKLDQKQDQIDFLDSALVSATKRIDDLEFQVGAHRRVIKMHGKSINGIIKHDVAQDSIIDKEIKNVGLTKKIGKTLLSLTLGAIGL